MRPHTLALLLLLLATPAATRLASAACAGEKFPAGRAYAACEDLPKLGASLHWTYDAAKSSLSVAPPTSTRSSRTTSAPRASSSSPASPPRRRPRRPPPRLMRPAAARRRPSPPTPPRPRPAWPRR
ncbi:auxin-responsive family protein [Zea mays]|uniref:Auxin-responsive family protein n=1 Tax=Zea mays TaxID=4577 RepID=A0A1D6PY64_MAIZE|nr:auxin-responsive family protein [Zea mays]